MDWSKGYSASYYAEVVDTATWRDIGRIEMTGGSVKRSTSGLLQSADIDCVNYPQDREQYLRIYLDARQADSSVHVPLFTGLAISPEREVSGARSTMTVQCFSVLKPADDVALLRGWYAQAGSSGARLVKELLSVCPAPVVLGEPSPTLANTIIAEDGETRLSMAGKILAAIGWRMQIDGNGVIHADKYDTSTKATFDALEFDVIENKVTVNSDWFSIPNVYMASSGDLTAIARDDSPTSPLSTFCRGREIWQTETDCDYAETETLGEYAIRKLKDAQRRVTEVTYDRRFVDGLYPYDVVRIHYPGQKLDGLFIIESQSISLGYNARTSEVLLEV